MRRTDLQERIETLREEALTVAEELSRRASTRITADGELQAAVRMQSVAYELGELQQLMSEPAPTEPARLSTVA